MDVTLAHEGGATGWDELLLIAIPLVLFVLVFVVMELRTRRRAPSTEDEASPSEPQETDALPM